MQRNQPPQITKLSVEKNLFLSRFASMSKTATKSTTLRDAMNRH